MSNNEQATLKKINQLFVKHDKDTVLLTMRLKCSGCGTDAELKIHKTSQGYGINGGSLFSDSEGQLLAECLHCYRAKLKPEKD